jgi:hypothetical protein
MLFRICERPVRFSAQDLRGVKKGDDRMALLLQEQDDGICPFKVKVHRNQCCGSGSGPSTFLTPESGMGKISGSGIRIRD